MQEEEAADAGWPAGKMGGRRGKWGKGKRTGGVEGGPRRFLGQGGQEEEGAGEQGRMRGGGREGKRAQEGSVAGSRCGANGMVWEWGVVEQAMAGHGSGEWGGGRWRDTADVESRDMEAI